MRRVLLILLLLPAVSMGEENAAPDLVAKLPACLRPGAKGVFIQDVEEDRLKGTLTYRVEKGAAEQTVLVATEFETADLGPLTFRYRLRAVLDAKTRTFTSFTYEIAGQDPNAFRLRARFGPDPAHPGKTLHERFKYQENGEAKVTKTRPRLPTSWCPDLLEPFCVELGNLLADGAWRMRLFTVERGRVLRGTVEIMPLGEGKMEISGVDVLCRILRRTKGDGSSTVYLRKSNALPVRYGATKLKEAP